MAESAKKLASAMVPYYPSTKYAAKNLAPEQVPAKSLEALASAQVRAKQQGVLSPGLADKFLAMALSEGYTGGPATITLDKGVVGTGEDESTEYDESLPQRQAGRTPTTAPQFGMDLLGYEGPEVADMLTKMGLKQATTGKFNKAAHQYEGASPDAQRKAANVLLTPGIGYMPQSDMDAEANANVAAVALAQKARLYGEDKAIERYNGTGPAARAHAAKVAELARMLSEDPSNAPIKQHYGKAVLRNMIGYPK